MPPPPAPPRPAAGARAARGESWSILSVRRPFRRHFCIFGGSPHFFQETMAEEPAERFWKPITARPGRPPLTRKEQSTLVMRNLPHGCTVRDIYETWKFYAILNRDPIVSINIEQPLRMAQLVFQHPAAVEAIMRDHRWCGKYTMYDDTPREAMFDIDTI